MEKGTFRRLLGASSISMLGSHVTTIAYPLLVLRLTGSPFTAGCVAFAATAPGILVHIPAGALVDRWDARRAMLLSELGRGVAIATVAVTVALGRAMVPLLIAVAVIEGVLEVFSGLAERRYVGSLVEPSQVSSALASIEARTHVVLVVGRPLGGLLFEIGSKFPFLFDVATFVYSVVTLTRIKDVEPAGEVVVTTHESSPKSSLIADMRHGLRWIRQDKFARPTIVSFSIGTLVFQALIMVFLGDAHGRGLSAFAIGIVLAASGVGGAFGSLVASRLLTIVSRFWIRIQTWIWVFGFAVLIFPVGRHFIYTAAIMAILGFTGAIGNIAFDTHLIQNVDKVMLARVTSVGRLANFAACAIGPVLGGVLVQKFGVQRAMYCLFCFFCFAPVLSLLSARTPSPSCSLDEQPAGPEEPESASGGSVQAIRVLATADRTADVRTDLARAAGRPGRSAHGLRATPP